MAETEKDFQLIDLIQESIETILELVEFESYEEFVNEPFIQLGVDENVYRIGQAANMLSIDFVSKYHEIDWPQIANEWNIPDKKFPPEKLWHISNVIIPKLKVDIITMLTNMD